MGAHVQATRAGAPAEHGHRPPDPRDTLAELREHVGRAEGHLAALHVLLRRIEDGLEDAVDRDRVA
jgi:hypothetical protein